MRILIFNTNYYPNIIGGAEISTQLLAETLSTLDNQVWVCTIAESEKRDVINGVNIVYTNYRNFYWGFRGTKQKWKKFCWHALDIFNPFFIKFISELIDEIKPDVVHTNNICGFSCCIWYIAKRKGIPIVHTIRDYYLICYKSTMYRKGKICGRQCLDCKLSSIVSKYLSQKIDAVVGISQFVLDKHLSLGYFRDSKKKKVIFNSVEIDPILGNRESHVIGFIGSIYPNKGLERLISDFCRIHRNDYYLEIAGTGDADYMNNLKCRCSQHNIRFLGRVNVVEFLSHISLLVVPSEWNEPFGRVVVEALSCECPVFVSNRGGMPELVPPSSGRVFTLEDRDSLYSLLSEFVNNQLSFSFNNIAKCFRSKIVAQSYLNLYNSLLKL